MLEKCELEQQKLYICNLIIFYILKLIIHFYLNINENANSKIKNGFKINYRHLFKGIYKYILYHIIYGHITNDILISFCKFNVLLYNNKKGRSFPFCKKKEILKHPLLNGM